LFGINFCHHEIEESAAFAPCVCSRDVELRLDVVFAHLRVSHGARDHVDFHAAQTHGRVRASGTHDKPARHCQPLDPNGKLDIVKHAGFWLRDENGKVDTQLRHICWDGCMFPNEVMMRPKTWNDILATMIKVREAHGWQA